MTLLDTTLTYFPITDPTWIFFLVLGIILFAPMLLERLRVPAIVGMIFAGVLVGPHGFHLLDRDASFELFGKVGLYYIMFLASLEMNLQDVQKIRGQALTLGLLSFLFPMLLGFGVNQAMGYGVAAAVLMAAMYASHTLIAYPIVLRYGLSKRKSVSVAVGGTIVADTLVLLVLAVVGGMFKDHSSDNYLMWLIIRVMVLGALIVAVFPRLARLFFRRYDDGIVQYIFVLVLVFLGAGLMEFVGMEGILGAFLVGLVLNRSIPPASPLMKHIEFVGNALFIPYFLIGVGMLINVHVFIEDWRIFLLAAVMITVGLVSKWLAAYVTQVVFKMPATERPLMFGLTNSRAAATLAVVLVGHQIVLPDGSLLLGEEVLNGAMMFILVTCVVSSFVTENACRRLAMAGKPEEQEEEVVEDRILVALSNPDTVRGLVHTALMMRSDKGNTQLMGLHVVLEDDPASRERGLKQLEEAQSIAATANVRMLTRSRWSVNVVSGISHTMKEYNASDLLLGLHEKARLTDNFLGKLSNDLIAAVENQIIISRSGRPQNVIRHMHILVPRKAEFEPGFHHWADRIALLASQMSCRVDTYGGRGTLADLQAYWERKRYSVVAEQHVYNEWHDFISIAHNTKQDHMMVFVVARKGTISRHNYMDHLAEQIERYFSMNNLLIIYPMQLATATAQAVSNRMAVPVSVR